MQMASPAKPRLRIPKCVTSATWFAIKAADTRGAKNATPVLFTLPKSPALEDGHRPLASTLIFHSHAGSASSK
eukprot:432369-Amphidinium_carterae.1